MQPARRATRASGFALIEILVAVLLFAIGILGLVGLQASMTQAQTDAKVRADAANLVDELAALMWSDLANKSNYTAANCAGDTKCASWLSKVTTVLPSGTLDKLEFVDATLTSHYAENFGAVTITLAWTMPSGGPPHKYTALFNVAPASGS